MIAGIRPEDFELAEGERGDRRLGSARPSRWSSTSATSSCCISMRRGVRLIAKIPSEPRARPGEQVELALPVKKLHVFDAETEQALDVARA